MDIGQFNKMHVLGRGRMATVYLLDNERVVKLFDEHVPKDIVLDEYHKAKYINEMGLPAPIAFEMVKIDDSWGIVYQLAEGSTLLHALMSNEKSPFEAGKIIAELHTKIHGIRTKQLSPLKEIILKSIRDIPMTDEEKIKLSNYIVILPEGDAICHLDFHPDNIMTYNDKLTVLDWANCAKGCAAADVANTVITISGGSLPPGAPAELAAMLSELRKNVSDTYLDNYLAHSQVTPEEISQWELPMLAYRYTHGAAEEQEDLLIRIKSLLRT